MQPDSPRYDKMSSSLISTSNDALFLSLGIDAETDDDGSRVPPTDNALATQAIGVSNFNADLLQQLINDPRTKVVPAVNQCNHAIGNHNESHSPNSGGDDKTVAFCQVGFGGTFSFVGVSAKAS